MVWHLLLALGISTQALILRLTFLEDRVCANGTRGCGGKIQSVGVWVKWRHGVSLYFARLSSRGVEFGVGSGQRGRVGGHYCIEERASNFRQQCGGGGRQNSLRNKCGGIKSSEVDRRSHRERRRGARTASASATDNASNMAITPPAMDAASGNGGEIEHAVIHDGAIDRQYIAKLESETRSGSPRSGNECRGCASCRSKL